MNDSDKIDDIFTKIHDFGIGSVTNPVGFHNLVEESQQAILDLITEARIEELNHIDEKASVYRYLGHPMNVKERIAQLTQYRDAKPKQIACMGCSQNPVHQPNCSMFTQEKH